MKPTTLRRRALGHGLTVLGAICVAACAQPRLPETDAVGLLVTGWGSLDGVSTAYADYVVARSIVGDLTSAPDAPCTSWHVGRFPFRSEKGLMPHAVAFKTRGFEQLWDGSGIYRLDPVSQTYVAVMDDTVRLKVANVGTSDIMPMHAVTESGVSSMRAQPFALDPRDGTDHLAGLFRIAGPNGLHDVREAAHARWLRIWGMLGQQPADTIQLQYASRLLETHVTDFVNTHYGDRVDLRFGYYANEPGVTRRLGEVAREMLAEGHRRVVIARETTDHNNYANTFWDRYHAQRALCEAGYGEDEIELTQIRQVGRTPEYNALLVNNLKRHFNLIEPGAEVALVYTTYGLPWPGSNPDAGPFSAPQPFVQETFHENAYLNFLSFRPYAQAAYGDDYRITFQRSGGQGSANSRSNNLYAYGMTESARVRHPDDPLGYQTLREILERAIRQDGRREIILVLSHWFDNTQNVLLDLRLLNDVPLNSIAEMRAGKHWQVWCERYAGPGVYEQAPAPANICPEGFTRIQITEAFDDLIDQFSNGYAQRIRGGLERFGVYPDVDVDLVVSGPIGKREGGKVATATGPLAGASLEVWPDRQPGAPDGYQWANVYRPVSDPEPNTGADAIRAVHDYTQIDDFLDSAKDDFTAFIGFQRKVDPGTPVPSLPGAVSPAVLFGPYRTLFNAPARLGIPLDKSRVRDPASLQAFVYNHVSKTYDPVYPVAGGHAPFYHADSGVYYFDTQFLGLFVVAERL